ncbi:hypothetical protein [Labilibaculum sp.]|uniref:hypothetical protein n=1 Tax=Labilibaculum sp. TaxID=2060723 RepID=UPI00356A26E8
MDNKIVIQLLKNKTEEIQSLLAYFAKQPADVNDSIELLEARIQGLQKDFEILKKNCESNSVEIFSSVSKEEDTAKESQYIDEKTEKKISPEIDQETKAIYQADVEAPEEKIETKKESSLTKEEPLTEHIQLIGEQISAHKLEDIQSAIGINDRFLFTRELFENNAEEYNTAITYVNKADRFETVLNWIKSEKQWDLEDPTVAQFIDITKRKF